MLLVKQGNPLIQLCVLRFHGRRELKRVKVPGVEGDCYEKPADPNIYGKPNLIDDCHAFDSNMRKSLWELVRAHFIAGKEGVQKKPFPNQKMGAWLQLTLNGGSVIEIQSFEN